MTMSDSEDDEQQHTTTTTRLKHPKKLWNLHRKTWTPDDLRTHIDQYLQHLAQDQPHCKNVLRGGRVLLQCSCLATHLSDAALRERVTDYLIPFVQQTTRKEQTLILTQRIQQSKRLGSDTTTTTTTPNSSNYNTDKEHCRFALPGEEQIMICSSALLTLLGFSRHVWAHCLKCADDCKQLDDKIMPQHGARRSNSGNALDQNIALALDTFFQQQIDEYAVTDNTDAPVILRSTTTKKGLYELFCQERGWDLVKSVEGNVKPEPQTNAKQQPICSLSSFLAYWKKNFPQLDVPFSRRGEIMTSPGGVAQQTTPMTKATPASTRKTTTTTTTTTPRRSFAETTNLMTSSRTLWLTQAAAPFNNSNNEQDLSKTTNKYQQLVTEQQQVLQNHNHWMQCQLSKCQEQLTVQKEEIRRLQTCLQTKEADVERLEAENKHLHAAIALFRVNLPPTVSNALKRKFVMLPQTDLYMESRDENQEESESRNTAMETSRSKRLRVE